MRCAILCSLLLSLLRNPKICSTTSVSADDNSHFAVDLYQAISTLHPGQNIICSPFSITLALGMLLLGAKGTTLHQLTQAMKLDKRSEGEEFSILKHLSSVMLSHSQEPPVSLVNALYVQDGFTIKERYLQRNKYYFSSDIRAVNFQDSASAARIINTWVESTTKGKIRNLFSSDEFNPLSRLVLVSAIYFKGKWKHKFTMETTELMTFTKTDGSATEIPMMSHHLKAHIGHFSNEDVSYQVLELPYEGHEISMFFVLPDQVMDIHKVEKVLTASQIKEWLSSLTEHDVRLRIPRFKIEEKLDLKETLKAFRITELFLSSSDLPEMTDSADVYVTSASHKAFIEVNEEGSEAAATTGIHIAAIMSMQQHQFVADHPFVFLIRHNKTGALLFMGRVMNPEIMNTEGRDTEAL
ncbi:serpin I2 [Protopterus annectens]|uniref:serpin I2 n=1 Tax=Protopterus annectens TaxID=7888 RepID=UPI001CFC1586|nr:serpin I2 [Protopterus annectens]